MKRTKAANTFAFIMGVLLSVLVSSAAAMCFAESFRLDCAPEIVLSVCGAASLIACLSMLPRRRWIVLLVEAATLCIIAIWQLPQLKSGLQAVLLRVTTQLAKDFPVPVMGNSGGEPLWFVLPLGILLAYAAAWVAGGKGSFLPLIFTCSPILVCCLLTVGIAPEHWLVLLTGCLALLIVTHGVRRRDSVQGNLLAAKLLVPLVLVMLIPILMAPPEDYVRSDWIQGLLTLTEERLGIQEYAAGATTVQPAKWKRQLKTVDLSKVGPKSLSKTPVLQYRADSYLTHLRGVSLGVYKNNSWSAVDPHLYAAQNFLSQPQLTGTGAKRTLDVYTSKKESVLYTAYFLQEIPAGVTAVDDAYLENSQKHTDYSVIYTGKGSAPSEAYCDYAQEVYTQLPEELREPLQLYLMRNGLFQATAGQISAWVKNHGIYDLKTPRTPIGEDFVLYFLEESQRGYCVHFASSTVLLLRAQGIPARYVTGYAVDGDIGQRNTVTAAQGHAWVEYFSKDLGWRVLDPTPADWQEQQEPQTQLPEQTQQPEMSDPPEPLPDEPEPEKPEETPETPEESQTPDENPPEETPVIHIPLPSIPAIIQPEGTAGGTNAAAPRTQFTISKVLLWHLFAVVFAIALIPLQRYLRLKWRAHLCSTGLPNKRTLAWWKHLKVICRAAHTTPSDEARAVAQKAKFSAHTVTEEERNVLEKEASKVTGTLRCVPSVKRFWYQFVRAFY